MNRILHWLPGKLITMLIIDFLPASNALAGNIAFLGLSESYWQVYIYETNTKKVKQVSKSQYDKSRLSWFPGEKYILINGIQGELKKLDVETGKESNISLQKIQTFDAVVSPNGRQIAFSMATAESPDGNHIWVADLENKKLTQLTHMKWLQHQPAWGPKGKWLYFLSGHGGQTHDIWRINLQTKSTEQLTFGQLYNLDIDVNQQNSIIFSSNRKGSYNLWRMNMDLKPNLLFASDSSQTHPSWSPDGKFVAYQSNLNGVNNIWLHNLATAKSKAITHFAKGARAPVWGGK